MRVRDRWLLEDPGFDEPTEWAVSPEFTLIVRDEAPQSFGIRALREDPEDRRHDGSDR